MAMLQSFNSNFTEILIFAQTATTRAGITAGAGKRRGNETNCRPTQTNRRSK